MSKLSKASMSIRKKWQEEAAKRGAKDVIFSQSQAMPVIFHLLKDEFRPLNITSIYETLKAVIPPPVLKACLDTMAVKNAPDDPNDDSEDDTFVSKKPKHKLKLASKTSINNTKSSKDDEHAFHDSVRVKMGRNANSNLYYLDQSKLENEGNGLLPEEQQNLVASQHQGSEELRRKLDECKTMDRQTVQYLSEPKNDEMNALLRDGEEEMDSVHQALEEAKQYSGNASRRKKSEKQVDSMCIQWRQRKRKCIDFLDTMEDYTEGTISKKKCLAGNGQIEVESDETAIKLAKTFHERMKARKRGGKGSGEGDDSRCLVGIVLGSNKTNGIERVYATDE